MFNRYWISQINFKIIMINIYKKIDENIENFIRELYFINKGVKGKFGNEKN